jgi:hypothetical protein
MEKVTVKYYKKVEKGRKDSFWFDGQVAVVTKGKHLISLEATGHIDVVFKQDGKSYDNDSTRRYAKKIRILNN